VLSWRHDIQHNDIKHNHTQHNGLNCDTQHKNLLSMVTLGISIKCHCAECHYAECHICLLLCWMSLCWVTLCWMSWRGCHCHSYLSFSLNLDRQQNFDPQDIKEFIFVSQSTLRKKYDRRKLLQKLRLRKFIFKSLARSNISHSSISWTFSRWSNFRILVQLALIPVRISWRNEAKLCCLCFPDLG